MAAIGTLKIHVQQANRRFLIGERRNQFTYNFLFSPFPRQDLVAEPHSSGSSIAGLRTGGHWFHLRLDQFSFRGLMIVIAKGFIPLSPLFVVSTWLWERASGLDRTLCGVLVKSIPGKHG